MTIDRHHYKYLHIESSNHKSGNDFKIKVPHGLNACSRVAVQNFSIPNTIGNTYGPLSKLYWVEYMKDNATSGIGDWTMKIFYIDLSDIPSYTQNAEFATALNEKLQNEVYDYETGAIGTHQFNSEDPLEIGVMYNEGVYKYTYTVTQSTLTTNVGVKAFVPAIFENDAGLWEHLGFVEEMHMVGINSESYLSSPEQTLTAINRDFRTVYPQSAEIPAGLQNAITYKGLNDYWRYMKIAGVPNGENDLKARTVHSDGHSVHENHFSQLYICSDTLGTDAMLCKNDTAVPTNILSCVINDQPKFSYLHYQTNTPAWMKLNDTKIQEFDIKIRDHRGRTIPSGYLPNFNLTLIFETIDEIDYHKEHTKEYLREAYRKEHDYRK
jgi:hypothetical protein